MSDKAMLVLGEAPESDDEEFQHIENSKSGIVENDHTEFDADSNYRTNNSKNKKRQVERESLAGHSDNFKMSEDTLLHKKLKEKNMQFYSNLTTFNKQMYLNGINRMNETNQQLVKAQVLLQDTVTNWKYTEQNLSHIRRKLADILAEEYIPKINI
ncbi:Uncharacterized protein FWK35_00009216 [Aphis craccivora]|uniref:Biogenesis of lysosome-related organelles complex 1 subunit 3 n=1 Tax=Aphis craccivora TaxID=307492 RepID=A0A6G0YPV3_APHCR|nr:Uncharacterized protein FWK35_00009216 [Aphis craccivora]